MALNEIAAAVVTDNDAAFRRVTGIGPKTAKLITVSLAGKLGKPGQPMLAGGKSGDVEASVDVLNADRAIAEAIAAVVEALLGLGYQERAAAPVVAEVAQQLKTANRNELLRASLSRMGSTKAISGGQDK